MSPFIPPENVSDVLGWGGLKGENWPEIGKLSFMLQKVGDILRYLPPCYFKFAKSFCATFQYLMTTSLQKSHGRKKTVHFMFF